MKCPHCGIAIHNDCYKEYLRNSASANASGISSKTGAKYYIRYTVQECPECHELIISLNVVTFEYLGGPLYNEKIEEEFLVWPKNAFRFVSKNVPEEYAKDYREATSVLNISPAASAALSRRCLQNIIHNHAKIDKGNLKREIDELINSKVLPSYISEALHTLREFGNFGAHPIKDAQTGSIIEVEQGEAEWMLDILDFMFDLYFEQPAKLKARQASLNLKNAASRGTP